MRKSINFLLVTKYHNRLHCLLKNKNPHFIYQVTLSKFTDINLAHDKNIIFDFGGVLVDWNPHNSLKLIMADGKKCLAEL